MSSNAVRTVLALVGGVVGGGLGYLAFFWVLAQGFYALPLPGLLLGAGCGLLAGARSHRRGIICGVAGVLLCLVVEWKAFPFRADESLGYFVTHVHQLKPITLIMIAAGGLAAYWLGGDSLMGPRADRRPAARTD